MHIETAPRRGDSGGGSLAKHHRLSLTNAHGTDRSNERKKRKRKRKWKKKREVSTSAHLVCFLSLFSGRMRETACGGQDSDCRGKWVQEMWTKVNSEMRNGAQPDTIIN